MPSLRTLRASAAAVRSSHRSLSGCAGLTLALLSALALACDPPPPVDAGIDSGPLLDAGMVDADGVDGMVQCTEDAQCDDGIGCTDDSCDDLGRCRNIINLATCDDGLFCNGVEQCDLREGCVPGFRQTCNDEDVCTVDRCDEEARECVRTMRDLDNDGDPDFFCDGGDCDDRDPTVSSLLNEICDDQVDNDCDLEVDESDCGRPRYDVCDDPLDISEGGFFAIQTDGTAQDYTIGCETATRDLVASFTLTEARSFELQAFGEGFEVAMALRTDCTERTSELACEENANPTVLRRRALDPGTYFVIISASSTGEIELAATFGAPMPPAPNDTCGSPVDVSAGGRFDESTAEIVDDYAVACGDPGAPDLVYTFTTTEVQDVQISVQTSSMERMTYSVRTSCEDDGTSLRCEQGDPATGILHSLAAGTYFIVVEGPRTRDVDYTLDISFLAPTPALAGDSCADAIPLALNTDVTGTLVGFENDEALSCGNDYRDVVYTFTLAADSDVTIELDAGGQGNIALRTDCGVDMAPEQVRCSSGDPLYQRLLNLPAGTYFLLVESPMAGGYNLRVDASSPPRVPVDVGTANNTCAGAFEITDATGGLFSGDTTTMINNLMATCGGAAASRDAVFRIVLTERSRVVASTDGSSYDTVLHLHGPMCMNSQEIICDDEGGELVGASLIDRTLEPGTYHIVVDGFGTSSVGPYILEVIITPQ